MTKILIFIAVEITSSCPYALKMAACQLLYEITAFFMENPSVKSKIDCHVSPRREEHSNTASVKQTVGFKRRRKTIRVSIINFRNPQSLGNLNGS